MKETYREVPRDRRSKAQSGRHVGLFFLLLIAIDKARSLTNGSDSILQILTTRLWIV